MSDSYEYESHPSKTLWPPFPVNRRMAKTLMKMDTFNGEHNDAYIDHEGDPDAEENPHRLSTVTVDSFDHNHERDSGRGSRDAEPDVAEHPSSVSSSRMEHVFDGSEHDSDRSSVGHFRPGSSTEDSIDDSFYDVGERPITPEMENTLENRSSKWNVFNTAPHIDSDDSKQFCFAMIRKVMKAMTYIIMLPVMLGLIILSKGSVLIAVSNIRPFPQSRNDNDTDTVYDLRCKDFSDNRTYYIKDENKTSIETSGMFNYTKCVAIPHGYSNATKLDTKSCLNPSNGTGYLEVINHGYSINECFVVRNYWAWSILLMICTPYVFSFLRNFWRILFKKKKSPTARAMVATLIVETLHTIGICILFFIVLPSLDNAILALMFLLGVATIPATLKIFHRPEEETLQTLKIVLDCLAAIAQLSILMIWPVVVAVEDKGYDSNLIWSIPMSLVLVSVRWWENFVDKNSRFGKIRKYINRLSGEMRRSRTKIQLTAALWKIVVSFVAMMFCMTTQVEYMDPLDLFTRKITAMFEFSLSQCKKYDNDTGQTIYTISENEISEMELDWVWVWLTNCCASLICYFFARSAAKMRIQQVCYSLPIIISTPLMFGLMVGGCELWNNDPCTFTTSEISGYLFYKCYHVDGAGAVWFHHMWFLLPVWWLSQLWIAWHIWFPKSARLATADTLFVLPLYDAVLMEQSLLLNRERNDEPRSRVRVLAPSGTAAENQLELARLENIEETRRDEFLHVAIRRRDEIPMIYICATMWHENETEMMMMLKSILKLDIDQAARKNAQQFFRIQDPDYYEFEGHIFFDNAFENHDIDEFEFRTNDYVRLLVSVVDKAAAEVHEFNLSLGPPIKYPTPYGGRLVWGLPGGNKIIVHLKDNAKIRHKKRWSQVMYMYYFLGYCLWMDTSLSTRSKQIRAENTFLLALDGDVDFEPIALVLLIDLMKRNGNLGAACGRIHPNGSGPMVWYQYFEYALGHWMQKATEHVIGCVLCSPGCFSLFRGLALMEDNVMATYTTKPTEPRHHIQYDQGEDRWLCTLILQQGYRVEYCAASDSITFSPEGFNEFFNQRRRWMPSTMANVFDLLTSWQHTTSVNDNISLLYIMYQAFLLGASIVGPGTIFMMMVGSMDVAFGGRLGFPLSCLLNFIPLLVFVILCYAAKSNVQLTYAQILTGLYVLVQMLVLIGILVEMAGNRICYPTTVFFLFVSGTFVLAAVVHPQEFFCLIHGFTYYLAIPTMYMLLMIYSMCNLHVVAWGTREVKQTPTEKQLEEMKAAEAEQKLQEQQKKKKGIKGTVAAMTKGNKDQEGWTWRCGDCCSYTCCPHEAKSNERIVELKLILAEMEKMGKKFEGEIEDLKKTIEETGKKKDYYEEYHVSNNDVDAGSEGTQSAISRQIKVIRGISPTPSYQGSIVTNEDNERDSVSRMTDIDEEESEHDHEEEEEEEEQDDDNEEAPEDLEDHESTDDEHIVHLDLLGSDHCESQNSSKGSSVLGSEIGQPEPEPETRNELTNPFWSTDHELGNGPTMLIPEGEAQFFEDLIAVYLYPIMKDKIKEEKDAAGLKDLRNRISVAFLMLNTIFVVVVFVMQLNMDVIYVPWPCGDNVKVEPIGFMFMMTFGVIMIVQIIGMMVHRTSTFMHIMATTALPCTGTGDENKNEILIDLAKRLGKLDALNRMTMNTYKSTFNADTFATGFGSFPGDDIQKAQKKVVYLIDKNARRKSAVQMSVGRAFAERFKRLENRMNDDNTDMNEIQKKLLGGATAGFFANRKTEAALKTYREMRQTVNGRSETMVRGLPMHGTVTSADYSVDYSSSSGGGTFRNRGEIFETEVGRTGAVHRASSGRIGRDEPMEDPEADY